jgi:hypothetical protein
MHLSNTATSSFTSESEWVLIKMKWMSYKEDQEMHTKMKYLKAKFYQGGETLYNIIRQFY